jgi:hypothetical protein
VTKREARRICRPACGCSNEAVGVSPAFISHHSWCVRSRYVTCAADGPVYSRCVKAKGNGELPCLLRSCNDSRGINYSTLNCKCPVYTELQFDLCCWRYVYVWYSEAEILLLGKHFTGKITHIRPFISWLYYRYN